MRLQCLCLGIAFLLLAGPRASAQVESVTTVTRAPRLYERVDIEVTLKAAWDDPFRSTDVRLDLELTSPAGEALTVPGFYERGASGGTSVWHVRFAPRAPGTYRGRAVLESRAGRSVSQDIAFEAAPSGGRGFLHPSGPWTLRFDSGEPFRGIGQNLCWEARSNDDSKFFKALHENTRFNYDYLFGRLSAQGGNFARVWMCPWNLPLEWRKVSPDTDRYRDDPGHFNASAIERMDAFVETAAAADVYVMLTLDAHGSLLGDSWAHSNYNRANGGPCLLAADFFTNPAARQQYKDRLRYLLARWGYSTHLAAFEFFNEVDNAMYGQKDGRIPDAAVAAWHTEMAAYVKATDPYGHLVTTSISHRDVAGLDDIAAIDLNQKHIYKRTSTIPSVIRSYVKDHAKPYVIGEYGYEWDWSKNFNDFAGEMDADFEKGLWLGIFSPTPIAPMSWWWEFFDGRGVGSDLRAVSAVNHEMLAAGHGSFEEAPCVAAGCAALAVRCGQETFALAMNEGAHPAVTDILIAAGTASNVRLFDPQSCAWTDVAFTPLPGGRIRIPGVRIDSGRVVVASAK